MPRLLLRLLLAVALGSLGGCSDLGTAECAEADCAGGLAYFEDPSPRSRWIDLGCSASNSTEKFIVSWELTVDPGPIVAGEAFGATFSGLFRLDELILDLGQDLAASTRVNMLDLRATVHVRDGVTSEVRDVVLSNPAGGETCAFDVDGNAGPNAGPKFPTCSPSNDAADGSNSACTGLGGVADPRNPCGQFFPIPVSHDCDVCAERGKAVECATHKFCVTGDLEIPLEGPVEGYLAAGSGPVLFGWDEQGTVAIPDESTRPDDPMWLLPPPEFEQETGPNGFRARAAYDRVGGPESFAFECVMASGTPGLLHPTDDSDLISFEIQTR